MPELGEVCPGTGHVIVVEVGRARLVFLSLAQLAAAIDYFEAPGGTSRQDASGGSHWEFQPWHSRLPAGLVSRSQRPRVLKALRRAQEFVAEHPDYRPAAVPRPASTQEPGG